MKKWECKFVKLRELSNLTMSENEFKQLGEEGWELTTTYRILWERRKHHVSSDFQERN